MTSSSPKKSDAEALESSRLGCRDNIINFESIQKITVSGQCPPPRPVSKPIEIQNNIKYKKENTDTANERNLCFRALNLCLKL